MIVGHRYINGRHVVYGDTAKYKETFIAQYNITYHYTDDGTIRVNRETKRNNVLGYDMTRYPLETLNDIFKEENKYILRFIELEYVHAISDQDPDVDIIYLNPKFVDNLVTIANMDDALIQCSNYYMYNICDPEFPMELKSHLITLRELICNDDISGVEFEVV